MSSIKLFLLSVLLLISQNAFCVQNELVAEWGFSSGEEKWACCTGGVGAANFPASSDVTSLSVNLFSTDWRSEDVDYLAKAYPNVTNICLEATGALPHPLADGCWPTLDLSPLLELPHLRRLKLSCNGQLRHLDDLLSRPGLEFFEILNSIGLAPLGLKHSFPECHVLRPGKDPDMEIDIDMAKCIRGGRVECRQEKIVEPVHFSSPCREVYFTNHLPEPAKVKCIPSGCQRVSFDGIFDFSDVSGNHDLEEFSWYCPVALPRGLANSLDASKFPNMRFVRICCTCAEREKFDMARLVGGTKRFIDLYLYNCEIVNMDSLRGNCLYLGLILVSCVPDS